MRLQTVILWMEFLFPVVTEKDSIFLQHKKNYATLKHMNDILAIDR